MASVDATLGSVDQASVSTLNITTGTVTEAEVFSEMVDSAGEDSEEVIGASEGNLWYVAWKLCSLGGTSCSAS